MCRRKVLSTHRRTHVRRDALLQRVRDELAAARTWVSLDGACSAPEGLALVEATPLPAVPEGTVRSRCSRARHR